MPHYSYCYIFFRKSSVKFKLWPTPSSLKQSLLKVQGFLPAGHLKFLLYSLITIIFTIVIIITNTNAKAHFCLCFCLFSTKSSYRKILFSLKLFSTICMLTALQLITLVFTSPWVLGFFFKCKLSSLLRCLKRNQNWYKLTYKNPLDPITLPNKQKGTTTNKKTHMSTTLNQTNRDLFISSVKEMDTFFYPE